MDEAERVRVQVRGLVQGVGFRPFVYRLAHEHGLDGWVRNDGDGVTLEVQGPVTVLQGFLQQLTRQAPPRSRIDEVLTEPCARLEPLTPGFVILATRAGHARTAIGPDTALCDDCLRELCDPQDRRWRHAFVNCTNCGPRFTITRGLPYDRPMTSMARFAQCPACAAEYEDPSDRRFHAQPNACPVCGPQLQLLDAEGQPVAGVDALRATLDQLAAGRIVAVKGLGGFHLVCDARRGDAVAELRRRKHREEKPLAVMVAGVASLQGLAEPSADEAVWLGRPERPAVLLRKAAGADARLPGVAPGLAWLAAMLPYTPLQVLLFHEAAGRPAGTAWLKLPQPLVLVMTSANPGGEPLVVGNDEAQRRLAGIADAFLVHDRDIVQRCDDSVLRVAAGGAAGAVQFIRRARGFTPQPIRLARRLRPGIALGGWFKNTACVVRGDEAFVSAHVGDLDNAPTCQALDDAVEHLRGILEVEPAWIAHDLHPDFYSTRLAGRLAARLGVPAWPVQHHHAHVAAVAAEHRVDGPVLGLAMDGVGLGDDGQAWGGEWLLVDGPRCRRLGHLAPLQLPGGDRAAREPWRVAAAALWAAGRDDLASARFGDEPSLAALRSLWQRGVHCPPTTSLGRWFDAAAAVLGVRRRIAFEGQAAMLLEGLAEAHGPVEAEPGLVAWTSDGPDLGPLLQALAVEPDAARGAARFHATLVQALAVFTVAKARSLALPTVACAGGCFLNAIVARGLRERLADAGLRLLQAQAVPPNDGGLSLGQAWVAGLREAA